MCIGTIEIKRAHLTLRQLTPLDGVCIGTSEVKRAHLSFRGFDLSGLRVQRHI